MIKFGNQSVTAWMNGKPRSFQLRKEDTSVEVEWLGFDNNCIFKLDYRLIGGHKFDYVFSLYDHTRPGVDGELQFPLFINESPTIIMGQRCYVDYCYNYPVTADKVRLYTNIKGSGESTAGLIYHRTDLDDSFITNKRLKFRFAPDSRSFSVYDTGQIIDDDDTRVDFTVSMPVYIGGQVYNYYAEEFYGRFYEFIVYDDQDNIIRDYRPFRVDNVGVIKDIYKGNIIYPVSGACEVGPDK